MHIKISQSQKRRKAFSYHVLVHTYSWTCGYCSMDHRAVVVPVSLMEQASSLLHFQSGRHFQRLDAVDDDDLVECGGNYGCGDDDFDDYDGDGNDANDVDVESAAGTADDSDKVAGGDGDGGGGTVAVLKTVEEIQTLSHPSSSVQGHLVPGSGYRSCQNRTVSDHFLGLRGNDDSPWVEQRPPMMMTGLYDNQNEHIMSDNMKCTSICKLKLSGIEQKTIICIYFLLSISIAFLDYVNE